MSVRNTRMRVAMIVVAIVAAIGIPTVTAAVDAAPAQANIPGGSGP